MRFIRKLDNKNRKDVKKKIGEVTSTVMTNSKILRLLGYRSIINNISYNINNNVNMSEYMYSVEYISDNEYKIIINYCKKIHGENKNQSLIV